MQLQSIDFYHLQNKYLVINYLQPQTVMLIFQHLTFELLQCKLKLENQKLDLQSPDYLLHYKGYLPKEMQPFQMHDLRLSEKFQQVMYLMSLSLIHI